MPDLSAGIPGLGWVAAYVLVAAIVLVLLGIVLRLARRSNGGEMARKAPPARRLAVLDQIALDEKRRLVLIQRDGVQHLVILGGANELLVESGIGDTRGARVYEHRDLHAPEPAREAPELPAFPAAPSRETPPLAAPSIELAGRQPAFTEPLPPRRAAAPEAPAPIRPAPSPRSEPLRPQPAAPAPIARRAEPPSPVQTAPVTPPTPILPPVPQPVLRAEPEPVRTAEVPLAAPSSAIEPKPAAPEPAAPEPAAAEPESPAPAAEAAKAGGLLSRLRRSRQGEPAPHTAASPEPALTPLPNAEPAAGEPRLAALDRLVSLRDPVPATGEPRLAVDPPDVLPEMPTHSVPEVLLDPPPAPEPEPQGGAAPAVARREPDMSKLFDAIVPEQPTAPARPAAPPAPAAAAPAAAVGTPREEAPTGEPAETPRVAVKIDPFFANMAQRLEETLRRPIPPGAPSAAPAAPARPATNAAEIERVIDLALSAPEEPSKAAPSPAPAVNPPTPGAPTQDELEAEMANLLGRSHR